MSSQGTLRLLASCITVRTGRHTAVLRTLSTDEALVLTDATDAVHYLGDALWSSVGLTNPAGTAATTYTYEPFGRTAVTGAANPNPFRFTEREDDNTGLYCYRAPYPVPVHHCPAVQTSEIRSSRYQI